MDRQDAALALAHRHLKAGGGLDAAVGRALVAIKAADDGDGESWAEDAARLQLIEALASAGLLLHWRALRDLVLRMLGLAVPVGDHFNFDPNDLPALIAAGEQMAMTVTAPEGVLTQAQLAAWRRGVINAAADLALELNSDAVAGAIERARARQRLHYQARGLQYVRAGIGRHYQQPIVAALAAGEFDGQNPVNVAIQLRRRFRAGNYNWERLARSEVAWAQVEGKRQLLRQQGIEKYDYVTADDDRVSKICRHLEAGSPYLVADENAPLPMRDSHPNCRCSILPVLPP